MKIIIFAVIIMMFTFQAGYPQENSGDTDTSLFIEDNIQDKSKGRFGLQLGYGNTAQINGFSVSADYGYFPLDFLGIGLKYSIFQRIKNKTNKALKRITFHENSTEYFFAPAVTLRIPIQQNEMYFFSNFSYGPVIYEDYVAIMGYSATLYGATMGISLDFGIDWQIDKKRYLGIMFSALGAVLKKYTVSGPVTETTFVQPGNISRVDVSLGYRFY